MVFLSPFSSGIISLLIRSSLSLHVPRPFLISPQSHFFPLSFSHFMTSYFIVCDSGPLFPLLPSSLPFFSCLLWLSLSLLSISLSMFLADLSSFSRLPTLVSPCLFSHCSFVNGNHLKPTLLLFEPNQGYGLRSCESLRCEGSCNSAQRKCVQHRSRSWLRASRGHTKGFSLPHKRVRPHL